MKSLVIIPARGGSKGIPHKNIKGFQGKPLIYYAIDVARELVSDADICVSTDDDEIINKVEAYGLKVPFKRRIIWQLIHAVLMMYCFMPLIIMSSRASTMTISSYCNALLHFVIPDMYAKL